MSIGRCGLGVAVLCVVLAITAASCDATPPPRDGQGRSAASGSTPSAAGSDGRTSVPQSPVSADGRPLQTSWIGNTFPGTGRTFYNSNHVQQNCNAAFVMRDGRVVCNSLWD